jgi:hypothetical protein
MADDLFAAASRCPAIKQTALEPVARTANIDSLGPMDTALTILVKTPSQLTDILA